MKLTSTSIREGAPIPTRYALGKPNPSTHVELSDNVSPQLAWSELPAGTKSLVLLCVDVDVPTKPDDVNKEGRTVPWDLPRADFYHWVLVDLPPDASALAEGEFSQGVTPRGKSGPASARGTRTGHNNYTNWFEGDPDMAGHYYGYDGPCPPWNDERIHHYEFRLMALDVGRCPIEGSFGGPEVVAAIKGHVLGEARLVGTYAIYPRAR